MPKYLLILVKYARKILKSTRRSCKYLAIQNFPERKWSPHSPGIRWDNFSSHTITLFVNGAFIQLSKLAKSGSWHCHLQWQCTRSCVTYTWCKKGTNRKRMSCSSPICHMQIFKSFDFRTMGLWIWITFILIRTVFEKATINDNY